MGLHVPFYIVLKALNAQNVQKELRKNKVYNPPLFFSFQTT
uniref:Uncharacterized protein n=1 Tax=Lepeophtheirus salmonis TaxID=72036 RepID=A0A0K2VKJ4_LEPSM